MTIGDKKLGRFGLCRWDVVVLMTENRRDMDDLLEITKNYGREWNLRFGARKCKAMEYNSTGKSQWVLGNNILEVVEKYTYLGIEVGQEGIGEEKQRKINEGKARRMAGMIINGGSRLVNKYEVGRSLWKGIALPYCLYGVEITTYRENDLMQLEKVQNIVGRWGLGAPRSTAVEAIRGDMGWSTFKERVVKGKLGFLKKIESMNEERWAKKVMEEGRTGSSWKRETTRWKRRENLEEDWNNKGFKKVKKKQVEDNGLSRWKAGMREKSTLKWYRRKQKPEGISWHVGDWGSKLLFKARSGILEVMGKNREEQDKNCRLHDGEIEAIEHLIK